MMSSSTVYLVGKVLPTMRGCCVMLYPDQVA
ncbi:hypothetical protein LINPERHAP1_LOCUS14169 [Linum perenne]